MKEIRKITSFKLESNKQLICYKVKYATFFLYQWNRRIEKERERERKREEKRSIRSIIKPEFKLVRREIILTRITYEQRVVVGES